MKKLLTQILLLAVLLLTLLEALLLMSATASFGNLEESAMREAQPQYAGEMRNANTLWQRLLANLPLVPFGKREIMLAAVMIENHEDARPGQEGLEKALLVEEWLVEGFISRFVAVFDINSLPERVGPVRSIRPYFLEGLLPWRVILFHAGGSPEALEIAQQSKSLMTINGISGAYYNHFKRDAALNPPHDLFIERSQMLAIAGEFKEHRTTWPPFTHGFAKEAPAAQSISVNFFNPEHNVRYTFSSASQKYARSNGRVDHQAHPENVLMLEMPIEGIGEHGRLQILVRGQGKLLLFRAGKVYEGMWQKGGPDVSFSFTGTEGKPLAFSRGQTWMTVLPTLDRVAWE
ncbi:MAG: DUF3048 domain-containing protein [Candidatus Peribacteraceae bacterium]|nr:DUF3048 domain-containing protein [Candidatus Peribacteraceae bacterium]